MTGHAMKLVMLLALSCAACGDSTPTSATTTTPVLTTETYSSTVRHGGATSRSITTSAAGSITVSLTAFGAEEARVGMALGLLDEATGICARTYASVTRLYTGQALSATADAGRYCVTVFDVGDLTAPSSFSVSITYYP